MFQHLVAATVQACMEAIFFIEPRRVHAKLAHGGSKILMKPDRGALDGSFEFLFRTQRKFH